MRLLRFIVRDREGHRPEPATARPSVPPPIPPPGSRVFVLPALKPTTTQTWELLVAEMEAAGFVGPYRCRFCEGDVNGDGFFEHAADCPFDLHDRAIVAEVH